MHYTVGIGNEFSFTLPPRSKRGFLLMAAAAELRQAADALANAGDDARSGVGAIDLARTYGLSRYRGQMLVDRFDLDRSIRVERRTVAVNA